MKKIYLVLIIFILLFVLSSVFLKNTGMNITSFYCPETPDYGFPQPFATHCMNMKGEMENRFYIGRLITNMILMLGISAGIVFGYARIKRK